MLPIVEENGKKVFIGQEDPTNPPVFVKNPMKRYCSKSHENDNDKTTCGECNEYLNDGKMQCPICNRFFDFLVGEDINGGRRGCEADWLPAKNERI